MDKLKEYDHIEIFKFLDAESLRQCTGVNKEWAATIGTNSQLMTKLPLKIEANWESRKDELTNLKRMHNSIILEEIDGDLQPLFETLSHILPHIKTAEIIDFELVPQNFSEFLRKTQKLEKLKISHVDFTETVAASHETPTHILSLKSLELDCSDWGCLVALTHTQLTDLSIVFEYPDEEIPLDVENFDLRDFKAVNISLEVFKSFFESQKKLETLKLEDFPISLISCLNSFQCSYGLKRVTLDIQKQDNTADGFEQIIKFLDQHKSTLEFLEITKVNEALMTFIWKNLRLSELVVHSMKSTMTVPTWISVPNHFLKKLRIEKVRRDNTKFVVKILQVYRSIQHLTIEKMCSKQEHLVFDAICKSLTRIRHLRVPKLIAGSENSKSRKIPSLEVLEAWNLGKLGPREKYFIDFKGIGTLCIGNIMLRDIVRLTLPDTKHLTVGAFNRLLQSDYRKLSKHCPKLRFLEFLEVGQNFRQQPFHDGRFEIIQKAVAPSGPSEKESYDSIDSEDGVTGCEHACGNAWH